MPGIHVRAVSQFDWFERGKGSVLTVPGSYWLCHKKNIYKFTFKYYRVGRYPKEFAYGKELLKIIRRIIKCQPPQGQQFGTRHLLVTYNHTSWTRQDKMFAMLKFQERSEAAPFARAFVLTVKIIPTSAGKTVSSCEELTIIEDQNETMILQKENTELQHIEPDIKYVESTSRLSTSISLGTKPKNNVDIEFDLGQDCLCTTIEEEKLNEKLFYCHSQDNKIVDNNKFEEIHLPIRDNVDAKLCESDKQISSFENNSTNCDKEIEKIESVKNERSQCASKNGKLILKDDMSSVLRDVCHKRTPLNIDYNKSVMHLDDKTNCSNQSYLMDSDTFDKDSYMQKLRDCKNNVLMNTEDTMIDSINLPYQYLIEKEIEDARNRTLPIDDNELYTSLQSSIKSITDYNSAERCRELEVDKMTKNYVMHTPNIMDCIMNTVLQLGEPQQSGKKNNKPKQKINKESDIKSLSNDNGSRSSDITDLVMEGLMFTIRQEKDSVSVVEQKTKLEIDEVLENSEKIETKEGEKCLLNSSLLKLENLVTMIELPADNRKYSGDDITKWVNEKINVQPSLGTDRYWDLKDDCIIVNKDKAIGNENINEVHRTKKLCAAFLDTSESGAEESLHGTIKSKNISNDIHSSELQNLEDAEEEDIIPEALMNNVSSQSIDILMDDINTAGSSNRNCEVTNTNNSASASIKSLSHSQLSSNCLQSNSVLNYNNACTKYLQPNKTYGFENSFNNPNYIYKKTIGTKCESNVARIVSNEIITVEQMPLALQNMLRSRAPKHDQCNKKVTVFNNSESSKKNAQSLHRKFNTALACDEIVMQKVKLPILKTTISSHDTIVMHKEEPTVSSKNENFHDYEQLKESSPERSINATITSKPTVHSNKLQDITKDFYRDLCLPRQSKNNGEHKCLKKGNKVVDNHDTRSGKVHINIAKFVQDITRGARVVVKRLSTRSIPHVLE